MKKLKSFGGRNLGGGGSSQGIPKNFAELQRLQMKMEEELKALEESFQQEEVQVEVGGALKIVATCDRKIKDLVYEKDLLEDLDMFNDMLKTAMNEIWEKVEAVREEKTNAVIAKYNPLG
ncbi:MAG: YbaB/EbfC family nucleoid-associated protein [Fervidobacterium sp.]|uniref:YbaB/EbfC family nucleoid-associated protein n=1 Tax=Fervidobacterium sp. TaxID=1871331 RepID=UPI004049AC66